MPLGIHTITSGYRRKKRKRVGRGNAAGRGTYAGRGLKGQRARSGGKKGLKIKGLKRHMEQIPKKRGFTSRKGKVEHVTVSALDAVFSKGARVTLAALKKKGMVRRSARHVKVLGNGNIAKSLTVAGIPVSKTAREKIEKAGGSISS